MTPLRKRMIEEMKIRNFATGTIDAYVSAVARFASYFGKSPEELGKEQVREYLVNLVEEKKVGWSTYNISLCALRFLYHETLGRDELLKGIRCPKEHKRLPVVLSQEEVQQFFAATPNIRLKAMFGMAYAAGLRVSEITNLRGVDIDSDRMMIHVRQSKNAKDRYVPLSPNLLQVLREYWKAYRPEPWLFPGKPKNRPLSRMTANRHCVNVRKRAGLSKPVTMHSLRHSYATHMLEAGADLRTLQTLLGHRNIKTTAKYTHVSQSLIRSAPSPFDLIVNTSSPPDSEAKSRKSRKSDSNRDKARKRPRTQ